MFACPAASSASEQAFSLAGVIYSKRRGGNMKTTTLEAFCFLHSVKAAELKVNNKLLFECLRHREVITDAELEGEQ